MKTIEHIEFIRKVVKDNRSLTDIVNVLRSKGYNVYAYPFGWGGVGEIEDMWSGKVRVQISDKKGGYNYVLGVEL